MKVLILGGGVVGQAALSVLHALGAWCTVMDINIGTLRTLSRQYNEQVNTMISTKENIAKLLPETDMVLNCVKWPKGCKDYLIDRSMLKLMEKGSVIAVFSLRGKPLNTYGLTQKVVYENEEFNLLQAALNIEDGIEGLRYNKVIIATDADVDGMHIRLLMITFLLQFFPDLIKKGHVYILQTPLFRVRNKKETHYCYTDEERLAAIKKCGANPEVTRFKGLGEISPDEFRQFIGPDMRLDRVSLRKEDLVKDLLEFYMGKNTMERQNFIIQNLVIEDDTNLV